MKVIKLFFVIKICKIILKNKKNDSTKFCRLNILKSSPAYFFEKRCLKKICNCFGITGRGLGVVFQAGFLGSVEKETFLLRKLKGLSKELVRAELRNKLVVVHFKTRQTHRGTCLFVWIGSWKIVHVHFWTMRGYHHDKQVDEGSSTGRHCK